MPEEAVKQTITVQDVDVVFVNASGPQFTIRPGDSFLQKDNAAHIVLKDGRKFVIPYSHVLWFASTPREEDPSKKSSDIPQALRDQFNGVKRKPDVI